MVGGQVSFGGRRQRQGAALNHLLDVHALVREAVAELTQYAGDAPE